MIKDALNFGLSVLSLVQAALLITGGLLGNDKLILVAFVVLAVCVSLKRALDAWEYLYPSEVQDVE